MTISGLVKLFHWRQIFKIISILFRNRKKMRLSLRWQKIFGFWVLPLVRLLLLSGVSALVGIADSVSSPYFCPIVRWNFLVISDCVQLRSRGFGVSTCGHIISARFVIQVCIWLVRLLPESITIKIVTKWYLRFLPHYSSATWWRNWAQEESSSSPQRSPRYSTQVSLSLTWFPAGIFSLCSQSSWSVSPPLAMPASSVPTTSWPPSRPRSWGRNQGLSDRPSSRQCMLQEECLALC